MKTMRRMLSILLAFVMLMSVTGSAFEAQVDTGATAVTTADELYADAEGQDFRSWMQDDDRWASLLLGSSGDTVGHSGCTITAVTKLIIENGLATPTTLTPEVLVEWLNQNEGFNSSGDLQWAKVQQYVEDELHGTFDFITNCYKGSMSTRSTLTVNSNPTYADMLGWMEQGYHMVLNVGINTDHWIAVDEWETTAKNDGKIYIMDSYRNSGRIGVTLAEYLDDSRSNYNHTTKFNRIAVYKTYPNDTDNYRAWSRYDKRWYNETLDVLSDGTVETIGDWGQALLALTKTLIQAGVIDDSSTPLDVLAVLRDKNLISSDGVIKWTSLNNFDSKITEPGTASATLDAATVIENIKNGTHYIVRPFTGNRENAWVAIDEPMTLATGEIYLLTSGTDTAVNAGSVTLSSVLGSSAAQNVYTFKAADSPVYAQLDYPDADTADFAVEFTLGTAADNDVIEVSDGAYVPVGTEVTVTAVPAEGYTAGNWKYGSAEQASASSFTFIVNAADTLEYTPVGNTYPINYTAVSDKCGFAYDSANPASGECGKTVIFSVSPAAVDYEVTVTSSDVELTDNGDGSYSFVQPAQEVDISVSAAPKRNTVYLDASKAASGTPNWYVYTWSKTSDDGTYDAEWIKPTQTAEGLWQFTDVRSNVIFVRGNPGVDFDAQTDKWNVRWNQSFDQAYGADFNETNCLFVLDGTYNDIKDDKGNGKLNGAWSQMAGSNTVYLYPKAIDVHAEYVVDGAGGKSIYDVYGANYPKGYIDDLKKNQYYAYTWSGSNTAVKSWIAGTVDDNGVIKFEHLKDTFRFYRVEPGSAPADVTTNNISDTVWGYTDILTESDMSGHDMYVLNRYPYSYNSTTHKQAYDSDYNSIKEKMFGNWDNYADIDDVNAYCKENGIDTKYAYQYWTKNDSRWNQVNLAETNVTGEYTGKYYLAQTLAKLSIQAGRNAGYDPVDFAIKAFNNSYSSTSKNDEGIHTFTADTESTFVKLQNKSDTGRISAVSVTNSVADTIYKELLEGKHIILRLDNAASEWVAVDEERTLLQNEDFNNIKIYLLRSTENMADNAGGYISSNSNISGGAVCKSYTRKVVYNAGTSTTPGLTRDFDYRRWSRYDGRWINNKVGKSHYMYNNGACVIAVAKMFVQAGVLKADANGNLIYDGDFDLSSLSGDFTPEDLRTYLDTDKKGFVYSDDYDDDGALMWYEVNNFVNNTIAFDTKSQALGLTYLKFTEEINGRDGYPRQIGDAKYYCDAEEDTIYQALLQGYHMLIEVPSKVTNGVPTWVVVDELKSLETGRIYVMDSEESMAINADTLLVDDYTRFLRIVGYKGATTPIAEEVEIATEPATEPESGEEVNITITSPALRGDETDTNAFMSKSVAATGTKEVEGVTTTTYGYIYNYIYGKESKVRITIDGVVKDGNYRVCLAYTEDEAKSFAENTAEDKNIRVFDLTADTAGTLDVYPDLSQYTLYTGAAGEIGKQQKLYLAVKQVTTKNGTTVESNVATTSMTFRAFNLAKYVYRYKDRSEEDAEYIVYRNSRCPLTDKEMAGYEGNGNRPGMPQYQAETGIVGNRLVTEAPDVEAGFNKELRWSADNKTVDEENYTVTLTASQTIKTYDVSFTYYDSAASSEVTKTVRGRFNTLIRLGTQTRDINDTVVLPPDTNADGKVFLYWRDDSDNVISVYAAYTLMITENASYTAVYGDESEREAIEQGDGDWDAFMDDVKTSYKVTQDNNDPKITCYTDFTIRFIDGDNRVDEALEAGSVISFGIVTAYDSLNKDNDMLTKSGENGELLSKLKGSARTLATYARTNVSRSLNIGGTDLKLVFYNYMYDKDNAQISNRNRADVAVAWDVSDYEADEKMNVAAYSYIVYKDGNGETVVAVSETPAYAVVSAPQS